jgi:hypothetical protein
MRGSRLGEVQLWGMIGLNSSGNLYLGFIIGKKISMKSFKFYTILPLLAILMGGLLATSCERKAFVMEGRTYYYQCIWNGITDFSPYGEFKAGGILVHHDDTSTIQGTWYNNDYNVYWTLNNPPKYTSFRGTFDDKGISGNMSDSLGASGIFQGARR